MALIECTECGRTISDKAISCPGCGCPIEVDRTEPAEGRINLNDLSKEDIWFRAYNLQYKGKNSDLPIAIKMYNYLITRYHDSEEAGYAEKQLTILGQPTHTYTFNEVFVHNNEDYSDIASQQTDNRQFVEGNKQTPPQSNQEETIYIPPSPKITSTPKEPSWPIGLMILFGAATVIISPLIGFIAGVYGLCKEPKRGQGGILIGISLLTMMLNSYLSLSILRLLLRPY